MEALDTPQERPKGLLVLAILTFISTGSTIFFGLITVLFLRPSEADLAEEKREMTKAILEFKKLGFDSLVNLFEKLQAMTEALNAHFMASNLLNILFAVIGALSAYFMLKRNHLGFHGYIIYNLLACVHIYFFVSPSIVPSLIPIFNFIICLIFVLLYARHLSWMKNEY
jgi:hypothetical protein